MKTLIPLIIPELKAGRSVALASVMKAVGSAPRGAGACQILLADGRDFGTVGGGMIERRALDELAALLALAPAHETAADEQQPNALHFERDTIRDGTPITCEISTPSFIKEYSLTQDDALSLGMVCGGNVHMLYHLLTPAMLPFFTALESSLVNGIYPLWLIREIRNEQVHAISAISDGQRVSFLDDQTLATLLNRRATWFAPSFPQGGSCFIEPLSLMTHTYLFGCGHVAQSLAPLLSQLDFSPIAWDDRPSFASRALFPSVFDVICAPFTHMKEKLQVTHEDEIVIMTRGHVNDLITLQFALETPAYYIGLIGSRSKIHYTRDRLLEQGFTPQDFARVHTPIGIPILAETPMEIAVSVAAEMIRCRAERAVQASAVTTPINR